MTLPTLITDRLRLTPATLADADTLWALWSDADVRRYLWDDRAIAREEAEATLTDTVALQPEGLGLWLIHAATDGGVRQPNNGLPVGCAGLFPVSTAAEYDPTIAGLIEPLVALAPSAWGRGYATEALRALLQHATDTLHLETLAGVTDAPNEASERMLRRAGFTMLREVPGPRYALRTYLWRASRSSPVDTV
jgi:RimJ/RimL family protein N-acetyltransferase